MSKRVTRRDFVRVAAGAAGLAGTTPTGLLAGRVDPRRKESLEQLRTSAEDNDFTKRRPIMEIEVKVRERILKPVSEVFSAIVDPTKMKNYFISGASGPITAHSRIEWEFADVAAKVPVEVGEVEKNRRIVFEWSASGSRTRVTIQLAEDDANTTVVTVNEASFPLDQEGVKRALGQNAGWTYTVCCLKAYLHFGINLRAGLNKRLTSG